jgi:hypothetical protein
VRAHFAAEIGVKSLGVSASELGHLPDPERVKIGGD